MDPIWTPWDRGLYCLAFVGKVDIFLYKYYYIFMFLKGDIQVRNEFDIISIFFT